MQAPQTGARVWKWARRPVLLVSLVILARVLYLAPATAPFQRGSSEAFWSVACKVQLDPEHKWGGHAYVIDERWFGYEVTAKDGGIAFHGGTFHHVPAEEAMADWPAVSAELEAAVKKGVDTPVVRGFKKWQARGPGDPPDIKRLLADVEQEWFALDAARDDIAMCVYRTRLEEDFLRRWHRSRWYWATVVFEWGFLTLCAWVAVWPLRRNLSPLSWGLVYALLPLLFLTPVYLGYATFTFTSAGPSGGILYPRLLVYFYRWSMNALDRTVLSYVPQLLEPISTPIGSPLSLSWMGMPGPTSLLLAGGLLGLVVALARLAWVCRRDGLEPKKLSAGEWVWLLAGWERFRPGGR
jgi:hypothetical protein